MKWRLFVHASLYCGMLLSTVLTQSCTKKVLVEDGTGRSKRVTMVRKIPAKCSNWDKAWVWITGMDCGTKYVLETVNFPSATNQVYQEQKVCCPHEKECINPGVGSDARKDESGGGLDKNDQKFLAITFGSATAALVIILLIIVLSFCRKQQPRFIENFFNRRHRMYDEDMIGVQPSAPFFDGHSDYYKNGSTRLIESEYEEIPAEYDTKHQYPTNSDGGCCTQELSSMERPHNQQNDYSRDVFIPLHSGIDESGFIERAQGGQISPILNGRSGSYENAPVQIVPPIPSDHRRAFESLSHNADIPAQNSMPLACISDNSGVQRSQSSDNSPSKCSQSETSNNYIDFSDIIVPNSDSVVSTAAQNGDSVDSMPPPKAHSYEKLDRSAIENAESTYDALGVTTNDKSPKHQKKES